MKELICVFLAFVLVLGLTACGKDKEAAENPTEGISESTTENTVKSTEPVEITPQKPQLLSIVMQNQKKK